MIKSLIKRVAFMDRNKYLTPLFSSAFKDLYLKIRTMCGCSNEMNVTGSLKKMFPKEVRMFETNGESKLV